jgi:hypothetical protein
MPHTRTPRATTLAAGLRHEPPLRGRPGGSPRGARGAESHRLARRAARGVAGSGLRCGSPQRVSHPPQRGGGVPMPPAAPCISSPAAPEAPDARQHTTQWGGDKVHLTDTCADDLPHLITHVETTLGPAAEGAAPPHPCRAAAAGSPAGDPARGSRAAGRRPPGREAGPLRRGSPGAHASRRSRASARHLSGRQGQHRLAPGRLCGEYGLSQGECKPRNGRWEVRNL